MTTITLKLTLDELTLLTSLAEDQLFRREFIDPKLPGHRPDIAQTTQAKALLGRLRLIVNPGQTKRTAPAKTPRHGV
ncbi:MAG: hypothetical protein HY820_31750 [Acidobacteria bacterium]|nr:hypothetical protein [Acidobacteriota bacterium]